MGGGAPNLANMTIPQLLQALSAGQSPPQSQRGSDGLASHTGK